MNQHLNCDPYNFPFPSRKDLMSLNKIDPFRDSLKRKFDHSGKESTSLNIKDIEGTKPHLKGYEYSEKEHFSNRKDDILGATAKSFYAARMRLETEKESIKGTKPQINKFVTKRPSTNPLEPVYRLQSYVQKQSTPPKYMKDPLEIDDIPGTRSKWLDQHKFQRKNIYEPGFIEGSKSRQIYVPKDKIDNLDVKDINTYLQFKTKRLVDPLEPRYNTEDHQGKNDNYGFIQGSLSRRLHPVDMKVDKNYSLKTQDVEGAQHGTFYNGFLKRETRKYFVDTNKTEDIEGAQKTTLKKGIQTKRQTDPNWPKYKYLCDEASKVQSQQDRINRMNNTYNKLSKAQKMDKFIQ